MGSEMCIRDSWYADNLCPLTKSREHPIQPLGPTNAAIAELDLTSCLLYTSDAADERSSVDLGGRRIIKKKNNQQTLGTAVTHKKKPNNESEIIVT